MANQIITTAIHYADIPAESSYVFRILATLEGRLLVYRFAGSDRYSLPAGFILPSGTPVNENTFLEMGREIDPWGPFQLSRYDLRLACDFGPGSAPEPRFQYLFRGYLVHNDHPDKLYAPQSRAERNFLFLDPTDRDGLDPIDRCLLERHDALWGPLV